MGTLQADGTVDEGQIDGTMEDDIDDGLIHIDFMDLRFTETPKTAKFFGGANPDHVFQAQGHIADGMILQTGDRDQITIGQHCWEGNSL